MAGRILSINISEEKGQRKKAVESAQIKPDHGIVNDAHAGDWHRQISLLAQESIDTMIAKGLTVGPGDFAENITTQGIELVTLPIGTKLKLGDAITEVTQIGKECHHKCAIYYQAGDCVMPREGIFVKVLSPAQIKPGDIVEVVESE